MQTLLAALYGSAAALDDSLVEDGNLEPEVDVDFAEWKPVYDRLKQRLGDWNHYAFALEPLDLESEVAVGDLADDLADIWRDLKVGLLAYESNPREAIWEWRFTFASHWGEHAVRALAAVQVRLQAEGLLLT